LSSSTIPVRALPPRLLKPILIGGAIAGTLDEISAILSLGWNVPRVDAAGLLGPRVIHGSDPWVWILGLALHYFIAFSAAAIYCLASRRLLFLRDHFLVCGLFYGIAVFLTMYLVVMPLCAFHYKGPYTLHTLLQGIIVHMLLIGLPIAISLRLAPEETSPQ
jgi:hypothetical protein